MLFQWLSRKYLADRTSQRRLMLPFAPVLVGHFRLRAHLRRSIIKAASDDIGIFLFDDPAANFARVRTLQAIIRIQFFVENDKPA
jgi:hypothetical protein